MSKLLTLHDGGGAEFLMNSQFIVSVSNDYDESGNPIIGRHILRTNVIDMTPQGPRAAAYQVRESFADVLEAAKSAPDV